MNIHIVWGAHREGSHSFMCSVHASKEGANKRIDAYNALKKVDPRDAEATAKAIGGLALEKGAWCPNDFWEMDAYNWYSTEREMVD